MCMHMHMCMSCWFATCGLGIPDVRRPLASCACPLPEHAQCTALHAHCLQASTALWLDADVVVLRNPWAVLTPTPLWGADTHAAARAWTYDIRYQAEVPPAHGNLSEVGGAPEWRRGETNACPPLALTSGVNGGQLLVHSAAFAQDMDRHRPPKLSNADFLDQDFANRLLVRGGYSRCPLPASFASAHWRRATPKLDPCAFVTMHTNGAGSLQVTLLHNPSPHLFAHL